MNALKKTHYALFDLPEAFEIDRTRLDTAYRSVQAAVHPDRFAGASDAERRMAMQLATQANEAYATLRDPTRRAAYLCGLHGADPQVHSNTAMPAQFLMQQIEWRERLGEARDSASLETLAELADELGALRRALVDELREAIDARHDFPAAADAVRRLMFVDRFADEVADAEDRLLHS